MGPPPRASAPGPGAWPGDKLADLILARLYDRGEAFFAVEELAAAADVFHGRLSDALDELRRRGHGLEVSPAQGVRLVRPVRPDAYLIERGLGTRRVARSVICFGEVSSTNDVAWDSARRADSDGLVVVAEGQRSGRGRQGRRWVSVPGANVLMSVVLIDAAGELAHEALTIASGLAVAEGIEAAAALPCELRWPNDVLLDGAKVCGVLVEARQAGRRKVPRGGQAQPAPRPARGPGGRTFVVGIGVNVNAAPAPADVDRPATCLADKLGQPVERVEVIRAVLARLDEWVARIAAGRLDELHDRWLRRCGMINQRIEVRCGPDRYIGRALDISPLEGLVLCCDDGRRVHLPAETSAVLD